MLALPVHMLREVYWYGDLIEFKIWKFIFIQHLIHTYIHMYTYTLANIE